MDLARFFNIKWRRKTPARLRMLKAIAGEKNGLAVHELAKVCSVREQTARNFISDPEVQDRITASPKGMWPVRYTWTPHKKTAIGSMTTSAKESLGFGISWKEEKGTPKERTVSITIKGIPDNGTLKITGPK